MPPILVADFGMLARDVSADEYWLIHVVNNSVYTQELIYEPSCLKEHFNKDSNMP